MGLRERKKRATWQAIRDAALRLINDRGYDAVSLDEIAEAAGVSRTTLFNYFASKEAIVLDPAPQDFDLWRDLMAARPADEPLWTSLRGVCLDYLSAFSERLVAQRRLMETAPSLSASSREHIAWFKNELRAWAAGRAAPGDALYADLAVHTVYAAMATAFKHWAPDEGVDRLLALVRACFDQAGRGLATEPHDRLTA